MVYCGKPSTGCGNCKSRRIKCDEARPHCQNCIKTSRDCPGYPSQVDLIFRKEEPGRRKRTKKAPGNNAGGSSSTSKRSHDETDGASEPDEHRDSKRQRRGTDVGPTGYTLLRWINTDARRTNSAPDLEQESKMRPSNEKQATTLFADNFAWPPQNSNTAFLQGAMPALERAEESSSLYLATETVAIAAVARSSGSRSLFQHAVRTYGRALAAAQKAMRDPVHGTSDETLMTILLFSLYESMTSSEHSTTAWVKHIDGAVAIVRARGVERFDKTRSLLPFRAVRTQMLMNALHQRKPIQDFLGSRAWLSNTDDNNPATYDLLETFIAMPDLLNRACSSLEHEDTPDARVRVKALFEDTLAVQDKFSTWECFMPKHQVHGSTASAINAIDATSVEEAETWPGPTHVYKDLNVLSISNKMRVNQMLCSSIVTEALEWLDSVNYGKDDRYNQAKSNIQALVDDICYSVPSYVSAQKADNDSGEDSKDIEVTDAMGAQHFIWPLYTAMKMRCIPDLQKRWLRGRLLAVTKRYGQDFLRRMNGEYSTVGQRTSSPPYGEQRDYNEWRSGRDVAGNSREIGENIRLHYGADSVSAALDHQRLPSLQTQYGQLGELKIDPALLADDFDGSQRPTFDGLDYEKEVLPLSPLQPEPIPVV